MSVLRDEVACALLVFSLIAVLPASLDSGATTRAEKIGGLMQWMRTCGCPNPRATVIGRSPDGTITVLIECPEAPSPESESN